MPITTIPALSRTAITFKADVDTFFGTQLPAFATEANALQADVNTKQTTASTAATTATTKAGEASASAASASGSATTATTKANEAAASAASVVRDGSGGVAGLTLFKLNLRNAANTITSWFTTAATVARTWTMPDKDGTVALLSDITYKIQTGSVTITQAASNEMVRTHASAAVVLPAAYLDAGYQVVTEIESAAPFPGNAGLLLVSNRATNGFTLSMTGNATSATVRWKTLHPNA